MKMLSPCELVIWQILPCLRAQLTVELLKLGLTRKEVGEKLGITQAAISQYLSEKRGKKGNLGEEVKTEVKTLAQDIANNNVDNLVARICEICQKVKKDKILCQFHEQEEEIPEGCNLCYEQSTLGKKYSH